MDVYLRGRIGQQVGRGECYDLADEALRHVGAKSAPSFGKITKNANYVWGDKIKLKDAQPGDILQFRNHKIKIQTKKITKKTYLNGAIEENEETSWQVYTRGHHTAVVAEIKGNGVFAIFEQHVRPPGQDTVSKKVQQNAIYVADRKLSPQKTFSVEGGVKIEVTKTTIIKVKGKIWVYRAVPK